MYRKGIVAVLISILLWTDHYTDALSVDPVASTELEQLIKNDFVISIRHIRPRRKLQIPLEALFMIDFPTAKHKLSFFLDRKNQRVTIDMNSGQKVYSKHFQVDSLNETSTIRSLALVFKQKMVTLFLDCKKLAQQDLEVDMSKLYSGMEEPVLKIFRERKYPLHFDNSVADALWRANCHKASGRRENRRYVKEGHNKGGRNNSHKHYFKFNGENLINDQAAATQSDKNRKRHIRDWQQEDNRNRNHADGQQQQQPNHHRRGDIPVVSGDCDDAMTKSLSELVALVKQLRDEVGQQRNEVSYLRQLIENCAGCQNKQPIRESCQANNRCYPGVQCYDTSSGTRCGHCPRGYIGDGKHCKPGQSCSEKPCYSDVQCYDTVEGAQCGPCPSGFSGDGKTCIRLENNNCQEGLSCGDGEQSGWLIKRKHEHQIRTKVVTTS